MDILYFLYFFSNFGDFWDFLGFFGFFSDFSGERTRIFLSEQPLEGIPQPFSDALALQIFHWQNGNNSWIFFFFKEKWFLSLWWFLGLWNFSTDGFAFLSAVPPLSTFTWRIFLLSACSIEQDEMIDSPLDSYSAAVVCVRARVSMNAVH